MPQIVDIPVKIAREEVLRILKYKENVTLAGKNILDMVNRYIESAKAVSAPKAVYKDFTVKSVNEHSVVLEGSAFSLLGKSTAHRLWNAVKVTLFVVTAGPGIEKEIGKAVKRGEISSAAVLDAAGSAAVEGCADYINMLADLRAREEGFKTTKRFSPGYGDWDIKEQKGLLRRLNAGAIGVALTGAFAMRPEKSVSGAIGWVK